MEIGSEFWLDNSIYKNGTSKIPHWLSRFGETILTSSGRGAISLLLQQIEPNYKTVLLPAYICESVISPFIEHGYSCYFYDIEDSLSPDIESIKLYENIGVLLHMGYYGFQTNSNLVSILHQVKDQSTIIIEDITHTLFTENERFELNDFYVGSIRKWFGLPSGGFLASSKEITNRPSKNNEAFVNLRSKALLTKGQYIKTKDDDYKSLFMNQFYEAETLLVRDGSPYCIDELSIELINLLDVEELVFRRHENFNSLSEGLKGISYLKALFEDLTKYECPFFFPVIIRGNRDAILKKLIEEKIYCPVHWPVPDQIRGSNLDNNLGIYNNILSIPCDQRYGIQDMERVISVLRCL